MTSILVTGAMGQLGLCLKELSFTSKQLSFTFLSKKELDITDEIEINELFEKDNFHYCINCAAYTAVDKAEEESERAFDVNVLGVRYLSKMCKLHEVDLIHISTDFVFDGKSKLPYKETDDTFPLSVYGETKLKAEQEIVAIMKNYFIIRTSWLYSEYGNNFVKTMLKLSQKHKALSIVNDQIGSPTYAKDLAKTIFEMITNNSNIEYGIYHFSNEGSASWFDFAQEIFEESNINIYTKPIKSEDYPTLAERPKYSVLNKSKIKEAINIEIPHWRDSLKQCLYKLTKN